jgi:phosphate transport system permease protein
MSGRIFERSFAVFAWVSSGILVATTLIFTGYLLWNGGSSLHMDLIFGTTQPLDALLLKRPVLDGLFPAIMGTLFLVSLSVSIAVPLGLFTGIYMAEFASAPVRRWFGVFYDILAGSPSIVVGLFGFSISLFLHRFVSKDLFPCLLISALSLAFLVLPYLIRSTQTSLENLPANVRLTALALGASPMQNLFYVLLPRTLPGILSGVVLSIGRCAEDTAVIMLTGVAASAGLPKSLLGNYEALPFYIYTVSSQYMDREELARGYGAAIILFMVCACLFLLSFIIKSMLGSKIRQNR